MPPLLGKENNKPVKIILNIIYIVVGYVDESATASG